MQPQSNMFKNVLGSHVRTEGVSFMRVPRRVSATEKDLDLKNGKVGDNCLSNGETRMQLSPVYQSSTGGRKMPQDQGNQVLLEC
jgi:hypothetical protein